MDTAKKSICVFLAGDVMTGRGIDQILPHPNDPKLYEPYVKDARDYVLLAEQLNGKIIYPVTTKYIWGDALSVFKKLDPDVKIINLETAVTSSEDCWPDKSIHYRMHPKNINVLTAAGINVCTLANNHILDWGYSGLEETLLTLKKANIKFSGAGENIRQSMQPAIVELSDHKRILVFAAGTYSSGVSPDWSATMESAGVYYLSNFSNTSIASVIQNIKHYKKAGDLVIFSIHWGGNWGYHIPQSFRNFAHRLIDDGEVDVVFGHSSHHPRSIELYHDKPILYGCGDLINDYEGISGYEKYRGDLSLMYFLYFDNQTLKFEKMFLSPMQIKKFKLNTANTKDREWLLSKITLSSPRKWE